jgi:tetratricopeptide (TPR) repeat protein
LDRPAAKAISLPDLSRVEESVREQVRERYSLLMQRIENHQMSTVELGEAYGAMGKILMAAEYLDAAEPCYLNAQVFEPDDLRWPYYLGQLYRTKGEVAKSAAQFEHARQLKPADVATMVALGNVYLDQGRPEAAASLFTRGLALQPHSAAVLFGLGRAALARQDYAQAVQHLESALVLEQRASIIHYPLALAYRGLGELGKAEVHFQQRGDIGIDSSDPLMLELVGLLQSTTAYEIHGVRALERQEFAEAAADFRKGIELTPDNPALRHKLGTALFMMGDARGALAEFEKVVRRSPHFAKAHYSLAVIMTSSGRYQQAIEELSTAVKWEPTYVEAHLLLADILRRSGRLERSLAHYDEVVKIDPRVADARFGSALTLVTLRRYQQARDRLTEGIKLHPDQLRFAVTLVRVLAAAPDDRVRDGRRAMALMQELLKEQPGIDFGETMAMALAELGQYEEAAARQREAIAAAKQAGRKGVDERMTENLWLYERRKPCRTPWRDDDPIELDPVGVPGRF